MVSLVGQRALAVCDITGCFLPGPFSECHGNIRNVYVLYTSYIFILLEKEV